MIFHLFAFIGIDVLSAASLSGSVLASAGEVLSASEEAAAVLASVDLDVFPELELLPPQPARLPQIQSAAVIAMI